MSKRNKTNGPEQSGPDDTPSEASDIANIFGLNDPSAPWWRVLSDWRKDAVDKAAIVRLLGDGVPVPVEVNPLLAGLLTGEIKARKGRTREIPQMEMRLFRQMIAGQVATFETMLKDPSRIHADYSKEFRDALNARRMRSTGTPNAKAREWVAECYGISKGAVGQIITERNEGLSAIAKEHNITLAEVKRALRIGEP